MKLLKGRGNTSAIWRVVSDDHTTLLGIVGEIKEMVNVGILRWSNDHGAASKRNFEGWVFIEPAGGKTMERLTRSANDGAYTYTACEATIGEILGRLTEYEDTGMTPEEVDDLLWENEWHDARECTPIEYGTYWVTINEDGMRSVGTAEFRADWVVSDLETIEAWMPMQKQPELYERRE